MQPVRSTRQMMGPERRNALTPIGDRLEAADVRVIASCLLAAGVFNGNTAEEFLDANGAKNGRGLVNRVKQRGHHAFDAFYLALMECGNYTLANELRGLVADSVLAQIENGPTNCRNATAPPHELTALKRLSLDESLATPLDRPLDFSVDLIDAPPSTAAAWEFYEQRKDQIYAHFTAPKGAAMIINNRNFSDQPERKGTDVDCANLHNLFTQLGYRVDTRVNQTAQDMVNTVAELATCRALLTASSLVLAILSHGDEGAIYGVDGKMVYVNQLLSLLNSDHCRTMAGKPKLVFIQACRGEGRDRGVDMVDGAASLQPDARFLDLFNCTGPAQRIQTRRSRLPAETDFLIAYATPPRHVSWRNTQRGSWFVQSICEVFAKHAKDDHIMDLMTRVNDRMATFETGERFKQASEIHTRLRKHLYFFPGMTRDTAV